MKNVSLIAFIGCIFVILMRILSLVGTIQWVNSDFFEGSVSSYLARPLLGIVGWCLIAFFFYSLYKNVRK